MVGHDPARLADYHMHLEQDDQRLPLPYRVDRIRVYVEAARARGVDEIGITEHGHRFREFRPAMAGLFEGDAPQHPRVRDWLGADFQESLERYVRAVLDAREQGLPVRLGIEVDYLPGQEESIRRALGLAPWDYVIGSVHFVDGRCIDCGPDVTWPEADVDEVYQSYFERMAEAARSGLFDVLAHPDLPKKFGHRPRRFPTEAFSRFVEACREADVAVEVNTAGLRKPAGEMYPAPVLLAVMVAAGLDVQLGSDAHDPEDVGRDFGRARELAARAGVRRLIRWDGRRRTYREL